jgi:hypothetical protein
MRRGSFTLTIAGCLLLANSVIATPVYINNFGVDTGSASTTLSLQSTLNARGNTLVDVYNDQLDPNAVAYWNGSGANYTITVVEALAGSATINSLSIFNLADPSQTMLVFPGGLSGDVATFTSPWATFGFVLHNGNYGNTEYSDPTLNGGNVNLVTYSGTGESLALGGDPSSPIGTVVLGTQDYLMAWEDTAFSNPNCDHDYNDLVLVLSPQTVPETPYTAALLLASIVGLLFFRRALFGESTKA